MPTGRFEGRVEGLLGEAREACARRDWPAVRALAESVLALDPDNEAAMQLHEQSRAEGGEGGEWRQLTVMFCDVVGSTSLAGEHDPELYREVLRSYQTAASCSVRRYEGYVANYIGDGILAYFGYPTPHEDDARRAVKAGLDLLADVGKVARQAQREHGFELAVRAAIHTGMVVRAEMGSPESPDRDAVVGETPNVAARLQDFARAGSLVISADTEHLVRGRFALEPLGSVELRGVAEPVGAFTVVGEHEARGGLPAEGDLSPFVGRERERERLSALWEQAAAGAAAVAAIRGEPGIGKSRLLAELRRKARASGGVTLCGTCSTFHATTHLYPARHMLAEACGIDSGSDLSRALPPLRSRLARAGLEHHLPLFGSLLGIPPGPELAAPELIGPALGEAMLVALVEWIEAEAARGGALLAIDDLQWADPSTLELLGRLIDRDAGGLLVLLACRADWELPWPSVEVLELGSLSIPELERIAKASPHAERLTAEQVERLVRRSDGVPFFLEELLEASAQPEAPSTLRLAGGQASIPPALLDPLLTRLTAPGVDLDLVQTAACIGNTADHGLLAAVAGMSEDELQEELGGLFAANLLVQEEGGYRFRHQLLRQLAYDTQLTPARRRRHARIAEALRQRAGTEQAAGAGRLAQHLELAGQAGDAVVAYIEAARIAQSDGAFAEATEILEHALELVAGHADEQVRLALELAVRRALGLVKMATLGYAAPEAVHQYECCIELAQRLEPGPERLPDLIPVWSYYVLDGALERAEEVLSLERWPDAGGLDEPPPGLFTGFNRFFRGDVPGAVADLESYLESGYARQSGVPLRWPLPNDPTVAAWTLASIAMHLAGETDAARQAIASAESRAAGLPFPWGPFSVAYAKAYGCLRCVLAGDYEAADADGAALIEVAGRHGFMLFVAYGQLQQRIAAVRDGAMEEVEAVKQALALWRIAGGEVWVPPFLTETARHQLAGGDLAGARVSLREAQAISSRSGAEFWSAETTRVLGEARLAAGEAEGVEDLRRAAGVAASQGALLFELRARTSLARAGGRRERNELAELIEGLEGGAGLSELAAAQEALVGERSR